MIRIPGGPGDDPHGGYIFCCWKPKMLVGFSAIYQKNMSKKMLGFWFFWRGFGYYKEIRDYMTTCHGYRSGDLHNGFTPGFPSLQVISEKKTTGPHWHLHFLISNMIALEFWTKKSHLPILQVTSTWVVAFLLQKNTPLHKHAAGSPGQNYWNQTGHCPHRWCFARPPVPWQSDVCHLRCRLPFPQFGSNRFKIYKISNFKV